jgi:hypothetical protein
MHCIGVVVVIVDVEGVVLTVDELVAAVFVGIVVCCGCQDINNLREVKKYTRCLKKRGIKEFNIKIM